MESPQTKQRDWVRFTLIAIALVYALVAGLRTVSETDLGWQMATGRYIVQHHAIPSTALFTYTVPGAKWVYPVLSGIIFHLLLLNGGFAALSWLNAIACAATTAILTLSGGRTAAVLAIVAVPTIALRTMPRADLFTTVLFSAVLVLLWRHHEGKKARLWLLPLLMLLWVNLHLGFEAGLVLMGGYFLLEGSSAIFEDKRGAALQRAKRVLPWIAASAVATLANPWGFGIYRSLALQSEEAKPSQDFIGEWSGVHFNGLAWQQFLSPRDPASSDWWILVLAILTIVLCLLRKRIGAAILLAGGAYEGIQHLRFQAIFAILAVVIGGAILSEFAASLSDSFPALRKNRALEIALVTLAFVFAGLRSWDVISERQSLRANEIAFFGAGESWWFPEKAMQFLEREKLPGQLFAPYGFGGYLAWRVGERYPVFADGRYIPFGKELFLQQRALTSAPPDSKLWDEAAAKWNINAAVFSLSRYAGLDSFPLADYCRSAKWKSVYADDVSILFVRNTEGNARSIEKFPLSCEKVVLAPPRAASGDSWRARAERFNFLVNSASFYYILSRDAEASAALRQAEAIFPDQPSLHLVKAQLLQANNRTGEAEQEYARVVEAQPGDAAWFALATLYNSEKRYGEAEQCVRESIRYTLVPQERWRSLGLLHISMNRPSDALADFDRADVKSPYRFDVTSEEGRNFNARMAAARAKAFRTMNDLPKAMAQQERATQLTPENAAAWDILAELAEVQGDSAKAQAAHSRAEALRASAQASNPH
jgi:tetratricopeptide (TPR) repeat protein